MSVVKADKEGGGQEMSSVTAGQGVEAGREAETVIYSQIPAEILRASFSLTVAAAAG